MRRMLQVVVVSGLVLAAGCGPKAEPAPAADSAADAAAARTGIDAGNAQYMAYFTGGHPDSIATLFADDGRMMAPNAPMATGRAAIAAGMASMTGAKLTLVLTSLAVEASGPLAVDAGTYKFSITPPGAKDPINDTGKYLSHWRKTGDKWLMVDNIWNSDMVMPTMAAPKP